MGACFSGSSSRPSSPHESEATKELPAFKSNSKPTSTRRILSRSQYSTGTSTTEGTMSAYSIGSSIGLSSIGSENSEDDVFSNGRILSFPNLKIFTYAELKSATKNFKPESFIGEGGFGKVYKGWVNEKTLGPSKAGYGKVVAVKKLNSESMQGWQEWQAEVNFLGSLSHPNLVKLLGYCWEEDELLLVYEFMARGSLENHLFRRGTASHVLSWDQRFKIALDAARGLAFLHTSDRKIIYRDFKASNILLDSDYNAKIADFGLAKEGPEAGESHVSTRVMGTYGYVAPEYATTGHLYVKSDVYGFGVVLLELLTGQRALDRSRPSGQQNLVKWAKPFLTDRKKFKHIMDPQLDKQYSCKVAFEACQLTNRCIAVELRNRPSMSDVVETLERIAAMKNDSTILKIKPPRPGARNPSRTPPHHRSPYHPRYDSTNMEVIVA